MQVATGLDILLKSSYWQNQIQGNIAYLFHSASLTCEIKQGLDELIRLFGDRVMQGFGPQHGFTTDLQDNMIESQHAVHPLHKIPILSLYHETRKPTAKMLEGIDTIIVDLQDVGTRVYTYIWTLFLMMEACHKTAIRMVILDRPNPIGGLLKEGNLAEPNWHSFVSMAPIPLRHGLTIGELALFFKLHNQWELDLHIIPMQGWERLMLWEHTGLHWINPSPNLPTPLGSLIYPGTVMFEGTVLSEGRGTTRSLELFGHPDLDSLLVHNDLTKYLSNCHLSGFTLRPLSYIPTFDKFINKTCRGFQIHPTNTTTFRPWRTVLCILKFLKHKIGMDPLWCDGPYEYEYQGWPIDWINGSTKIREWIEASQSSLHDLNDIEEENLTEFEYLVNQIKIY